MLLQLNMADMLNRVRRDPETELIYPKKIIDHVYIGFNGKQVLKVNGILGFS